LVTASWETGAALEEGTCEFSKQLQNMEPRLEFIGKIKTAKQAAASPYGEQTLYAVNFRDNNGNQVEIDTFSYDCLTCHDGVNTRMHVINFKNDSQNRGSSQALSKDHPIGMHYGSYAYSSDTFRRLYELNEDMILVDGKVGCLTCHNPLKPEKKHLASSNLCLGCHVK
jgi:hypothetical protein